MLYFDSSVVDGGWSLWTQGPCSKTCGGGMQEYTRTCNNPTPLCSGLSCRGNNTREESCNAFCCSGKDLTYVRICIQKI